MSGSSKDRGWRHRRSPGPADPRDAAAEPEEGELVPGRDDDSDMNTEDYYNNHDYYSSTDTDETTSDCNVRSVVVPASYGGVAGPFPAASAAKNNRSSASSSPVAAPAAVLACPICGKEFRSRKAVCGHMKVHQHGTIGKDKGIKRSAAVACGWGGTGKRGSSGCWSKPASLNAQSDQSMAIVVANPNIVLQPMPLAFAAPNPLPPRMESATPNQSSLPMASATPNPSSVPIASTVTNVSDESSSAKPMHSDAMETVVAGAGNPRTDVHLADAARSPPSPPPPAEVHATSVHQQPIEQPPPPPPDAEEERVQLPPVHHHPHPIAPPPLAGAAGRQNPNGYTCKQCGVWFAMHQGLGGHMAGHKTRELAAVPCRRDADKPEKVHACRICGAVFPAGVQLGGHMRKHYTGAPIVPKKKPRLAIQPLPPPVGPAPRPAMAGTLRLFGFDIVAGAQTPAAQEEGSSSATQAPSASTGAEQ